MEGKVAQYASQALARHVAVAGAICRVACRHVIRRHGLGHCGRGPAHVEEPAGASIRAFGAECGDRASSRQYRSPCFTCHNAN